MSFSKSFGLYRRKNPTPGSMFQWINLSARKSFCSSGTRPKEYCASAIRCPECQSVQVHYPQFAHRSLIPNLMMGFLARIGLIEKEYYCENCHYTWPKDGTKRSILYLERKPYRFVGGIEQTMLRPKPAQSESTG